MHIGFLHFWTKTALSPGRRASDVHRLIAGAANPFARTAICCLGALPDLELPKFEVGSLKLEGPTSDFQLLTSKVRSWKSEVVRSNFQLQTPNFELPKFEVGILKLEGPTSDFQLLTSKVRSWKSEVGRSNFQLQTSNF